MSEYTTWNRPIVGTPPQHCSAIAVRVEFDKDKPVAIPEGAIMISAPRKESAQLDLISRRSFGTASSSKGKSLLDMTPFFDPTFQGVQNEDVPLVIGVASDAIAPSSRSKLDSVASAYIHGACNARCNPDDSDKFVAGDLVYVQAAANKSELYAVPESEVKTGVERIAGILGTCLENGDRNSPFVRVFVDNLFNTMLSCC